MTAKPKTKRVDCLSVRLKIDVPLDHDNPETYAMALKVIADVRCNVPAGATVETISQGFSKMAAPEKTATPTPIAGSSTVGRDANEMPGFLKRQA